MVMKDGTGFVALEDDASTQDHEISEQVGTTDMYVHRAWASRCTAWCSTSRRSSTR